jgi:hypothetical protein
VSDSSYCASTTTVDTVECAIHLQRGMAPANEHQSGDRHIVLRVGFALTTLDFRIKFDGPSTISWPWGKICTCESGTSENTKKSTKL